MNYLAHAYLSFHQPEILAGNMVSDFVKGKKKFEYSLGIQKGIALHRAIDEFTDAHPYTKIAKQYFRPAYRLYSGAFVDVVYDHFLAGDKNEFENISALQNFTQSVYHALEKYFSQLPGRFQDIFPHMKQHDWLFNYQYALGIEKSFSGLARRSSYINESSTAFLVFIDNYKDLKMCYENFFPDVKRYAIDYLNNLL